MTGRARVSARRAARVLVAVVVAPILAVLVAVAVGAGPADAGSLGSGAVGAGSVAPQVLGSGSIGASSTLVAVPAAPGQVPGVGDPQPAEEPGAGAIEADDGERTGPDPSGQAVPDDDQRVVDTVVWLGLVVTLVLAAVLVARTWWRIPQDPPLLGRRPSEDPAPPGPGQSAAEGAAGADEAAGGQH